VLVCEPAHVPLYAHAHHVRVSPFSENHFPLRPFVTTSGS
jgi:hypothetical protein